MKRRLFLSFFTLCIITCQAQTFDNAVAAHKQATLEYSIGNFGEAHTLFIKTISILDTLDLVDTPFYKECLVDLSACLYDLAESYEGVDVSKSIEFGLDCLALKRRANDSDTLSILSCLGEYYKELGEFQIAKTYLKNVLSLHHRKDDDLYINTNIRLASLYGRMGYYDSAYIYSENARQLEQTIHGNNTTRYATIVMNSGLYKYMGGDVESGTILLKMAYNHPKCDKRNITFNLAGIYSRQGEADSCYKYLNESWIEIKRDVTNTLLKLSKEDQYSYLIQESTYNLITSPVNYFLQHEENEGLLRLAYTCIMYYKHLTMESLWDINNTSYDEWLIDSLSVSLDSNEVAIETWADLSDSWYSDYLLVFIIKPNANTPSVVKLSRDHILRTLYNEIPTTETYLPLYENIWKDILNAIDLEKGGRIYMVCDDILSQIPIESICDYNWEYIGDMYDVVRVYSTANIPRFKGDTIRNSIALYGGLKYDCDKNNNMADTLLAEVRGGAKYLPWTEAEVDKIKAIVDSTNGFSCVALYTGFNGTEESVKCLSSNSPSILHFATHGLFLQPTVEMDWHDFYNYCMNNAGLVLSCSSDEKEDGFLYAEEIRFLDFNNTDLLVLSACNTGLGGITPWGIVGLQQAFKASGVNTIIMTIGKINDIATSLFMEEFYDGLLNGMTKRDAFKHAQLALRRNEYFSNFNYWAYFIMID